MKFVLYLMPYTETNSKWINDLNIRLNTIKLVEENVEGKVTFKHYLLGSQVLRQVKLNRKWK